MKQYDQFVVFEEGKPLLIAEVWLPIKTPGIIHGKVVHGGWEFTLNQVTGEATTGTKLGYKTFTGWRATPMANYPGLSGSTAERLKALEKYSYGEGKASPMTMLVLRIGSAFLTYKDRLPLAFKAFAQIMRGETLYTEKEAEDMWGDIDARF